MKKITGYLAGIILSAAIFSGAYLYVHDDRVLTVGLYPWVPRVEQFQNVLQASWDKLETGYTLKFADAAEWDGGYKRNPDGIDVFVFDAIHLNFYKKNGYLSAVEPGQVENPEDILPYARNGVTAGERMYGIPLLGCANFLFYEAGDPIARKNSFSEITHELGSCTYTSKIPPDRRGVMVDMAGATTNASFYIETMASHTGAIPASLPVVLDEKYLQILRQLMTSASYYNASDCDLDGSCGGDPSYVRAAWFNKGYGRAYIGFTESMTQIDGEKLKRVKFKLMPMSDRSSVHLFYSDVVGLNAKTLTGPEKLRAALRLANLMASGDIVIKSIGPYKGAAAQYLMPVRYSVFDALSKEFPRYAEMRSAAENARPVLFALPENSKEWIAQMNQAIKSGYRKDYTCGCDFKVSSLYRQEDADRVCPGVCEARGGWNGQWVSNACGCRRCEMP